MFGRRERIHERMHDLVGLGGQQHVDDRQALVIHAPAVVQRMVLRNLDDRRGGLGVAEGSGQRAGQVGPVEAEDDIRARDCFACFRHRIDARGPRMQRMVGGKAGATLRSVTTCAFSVSASRIRAAQAASSRETRPTSSTGRSAPDSSAATRAICSAEADAATAGM